MVQQIVSFEQAQKLKKLDFDWCCDMYYTNSGRQHRSIEVSNWNSDCHYYYFAPSIHQALQWFRHKHDALYSIVFNKATDNYEAIVHVTTTVPNAKGDYDLIDVLLSLHSFPADTDIDGYSICECTILGFFLTIKGEI